MSDEAVQRIMSTQSMMMKMMSSKMVLVTIMMLMTYLLRSGWFHSTPSSRIVTVTPFPL